MAIVSTDQGDFELCSCDNPEGHVGPVWHVGHEHPSGAQLAAGEAERIETLIGATDHSTGATVVAINPQGG